MRRNILLGTVAAVAIGAVGVVWLTRSTAKDPVQNVNARQGSGDAAPSLPLSQVVLFSSGVGYFQREGEVTDNARIDLQFPIGDVNDLLKSLVLQDMGSGKIGAISYDGQDPIEKTLRSFAVDLTGNPSFGQVLNQARGEKVEVIMQTTANNQPGTVTGTIMGMESQQEPSGPGAMREVHMLNLVCAEGMRCINLKEVQRLRFLNTKLDAELKRALEVLASSHDSLKKQVSLSFKGEGKRKVRVGYVAENPIWKTSYRLSVDAKTNLQGWAAVENVTDEDWNDVRVVLVSGRPISFQMDLYPPLYVPRPTVEPERFASLRPPTYNGALNIDRSAMGMVGFGGGGNNLGFGGGIGGFGGGGFQGQFGNLGGQLGQQGFGGNFSSLNRYQGGMNNTVNPMQNPALNVANGQLAQNQPGQPQNADNNNNLGLMFQNSRLSYEQLQQRRNEQLNVKNNNDMSKAKQIGAKLAALDPHQSIASVAAAEEIGDAFRYVIEDKVSLPRQKSALLPLLDKEISAARVSIYNEAVHGKFPLLGLRFKNNTGQPLTQGPVTVFEDGSYAGDARMPDLQPDEERLISYAVDLGTEVKAEDKLTPGPKMVIRTSNNQLQVSYTVRHTRTYVIRNRGKLARTLVVEHPVRSNWRLDEASKPREETRDLYRFDVALKGGETVKFDVHELQGRADPFGQQWAKTPSSEVVETHFDTNLSLEVDQIVKTHAVDLLGVKIVKGEVQATSKHKSTRTYRVLNRAKEDRDVTVEHLVPAEWVLVGDAKPVEGTNNHLYRFPLKVEKGKAMMQEVVEERTATVPVRVSALTEDALQLYLGHAAVSAKVKDALTKVSAQKAELAETVRQVEETDKQIKEITTDQERLRQNLSRLPATSEAHKRYVKKFDDQETQIEKLQEQLKQKQATAKTQQKTLDDAFKGLAAE